jgi:hypothetical protein
MCFAFALLARQGWLRRCCSGAAVGLRFAFALQIRLSAVLSMRFAFALPVQ